MLTKHPMLAGKLVEAWTEPALRENGEPTKYRLVADESDEVIGAVSGKYRLVRNADLVAALDIAAEERGLVLEPSVAAYRGGRSKYAFIVPTLAYKPGMDKSVTHPQIVLRNDYRGGGGIRVESGYFRVICTNGLVRGTVAYRDNQRHIGLFSIPEFVGAALDRIHEIFEADRLVAETLAATPIIAGQELLDKLMADTATRYQPDLERAVRENVRDMGDNAWAHVQAVAEVATHRMQQRAEYNMAADAWAARMDRIVREHAEVV